MPFTGRSYLPGFSKVVHLVPGLNGKERSANMLG